MVLMSGSLDLYGPRDLLDAEIAVKNAFNCAAEMLLAARLPADEGNGKMVGLVSPLLNEVQDAQRKLWPVRLEIRRTREALGPWQDLQGRAESATDQTIAFAEGVLSAYTERMPDTLFGAKICMNPNDHASLDASRERLIAIDVPDERSLTLLNAMASEVQTAADMRLQQARDVSGSTPHRRVFKRASWLKKVTRGDLDDSALRQAALRKSIKPNKADPANPKSRNLYAIDEILAGPGQQYAHLILQALDEEMRNEA